VPAPAVAVAVKARHAVRAARDSRVGARVASLAGTALVVAVAVPMTAIVVAVGGTRDPAQLASAPSSLALADIPAEALGAYQDAGTQWQMDWTILAAIGKVECDHGRAQLAGCNPPDTVNSAGARGYMQFIGTTWRGVLGQFELEPRTSPPAADGDGYATDGDNDGDADPWSWLDATHSAARYLTANNATSDPGRAVWHYNHDDTYVDRVLQLAAGYRSAQSGFEGTPGDVPLVTVEGITVHEGIATQVAALIDAARAAGFDLTGGGYRAPAEQIALRRSHCGTTDYAVYEMPPSQCTPPTARPGESMHERGLAIDFSCDGALITSRSTNCYLWLAGHAGTYGLFELATNEEPWHWSTTGG